MTIKQMNLTRAALALGLLVGAAGAARAESPAAASAKADVQKTFGFVPQFIGKLPEPMLPGVWEELKTLQLNPRTALPGKTKELIGLAVAAQVPCRYCIVAHTDFARLNGATDADVGEAVAMAAITRHWSTFLNGIQTDEAKFRGEVTKIIDNVKKASATTAKGAPPAPVAVVDGATALQDATQMLGYVPEFVRTFPDVARAGAWKQLRDVQLSPSTSLNGKEKELVGLAVASHVPCRYCVIAHTEFAKLNGATDAEIREAIAMAALTRNMSTLLNGLQIDESQFRRDVDRLIQGAKTSAAKSPAPKKLATTTQR